MMSTHLRGGLPISDVSEQTRVTWVENMKAGLSRERVRPSDLVPF